MRTRQRRIHNPKYGLKVDGGEPASKIAIPSPTNKSQQYPVDRAMSTKPRQNAAFPTSITVKKRGPGWSKGAGSPMLDNIGGSGF